MADPIGIRQDATDQATSMWSDIYGGTAENLQPFMEAGQQALPNLQGLAGQQYGGDALTALGGMNPNVSVDYNAILADPNYQYTNQQAQEAGRRALASQGMLGSRYGVNALGDIGRQVASAESDRMYGRGVDNYNRAYGQQSDLFNFQNQMGNNEYNKYMGLASLGQNAATNLANAGSGYAGAYGDLLTGMANAQASGILSGNALSAQQSADQNNMWAGLAGTALQNIGGISDAAGTAWDTVSDWFS